MLGDPVVNPHVCSIESCTTTVAAKTGRCRGRVPEQSSKQAYFAAAGIDPNEVRGEMIDQPPP